MDKRLNDVDVVEFAEYIVVLEHIKNTPSGAPRYEATIIYNGQGKGINRAGHKYRFTGHYLSERQEAEYILEQYLKEMN